MRNRKLDRRLTDPLDPITIRNREQFESPRPVVKWVDVGGGWKKRVEDAEAIAADERKGGDKV